MSDPVPSSMISDATVGGLSVIVVTGGSTGDVLAQQADGTYAPASPGGAGSFLPLSGGTLTGPVVVTSAGSITINGVADLVTNYQRLAVSNSGANVATYDVQNGGTGAVGYHNFCVGGVNKQNIQATVSQFYVNLLAGSDNFYTLGRKSATPYRFSEAYFGTSCQIGAAANILPAGALHVVSTGTTVVTSVIECIASQSVSAIEVRKSDASVVMSVGPTGAMVVANTIEQRNSTTAQATYVYNTYTSGTSYERFTVDWVTTANTCRIGTEKGSGGGSARDLAIVTDGTVRLTISTTGTATFVGPVIAPAATTSIPSIRLPHGTAPTSPTNGDVWTTTGGQFARINGVTHKTGGETRTIGVAFDGGGSVLPVGKKGRITVPFDCVITAWRIISDVSGSIVVDVWKDTYANAPPTVSDTIAASAKPTLSSASKNEDTTLTGWTTAVSAGDVIIFNIDSATTVTEVTVQLSVRLS